MPETKCANNKKLDTDLWIIMFVTLAALMLFMLFQTQIYGIIKNSRVPILLRVAAGASVQFGLAGLGITVVSVFRKERFYSYGLKRSNALLSIILSILCFIPNIIFVLATNQYHGFSPFSSVWTTKDVLASGFPENIIGILITATVWGFFEGFNYAVISEKINKRYPSKNKWLNYGAIVCAVMCVLIHGAVGITPADIIEMITIMIIIYGMLMVKEFTGSAWGCVFVFIFLWNAF